MQTTTTHERYVHAVRDAIISRIPADTLTAQQVDRLRHAKLLYGVGDGSYRGVCYYEAWQNGVGKVDVVEIAATGQENFVQLAGTVLHELAHTLTQGDGHGLVWKDMCKALGFTIRPAAAGQVYRLAMFSRELRHTIYRLAAEISDGSPAFATYGIGMVLPGLPTIRLKPCSMGTGTKGGTSRGKGSGSRMRLWECDCPKPVKVRVASDDFRATCDHCAAPFHRA